KKKRADDKRHRGTSAQPPRTARRCGHGGVLSDEHVRGLGGRGWHGVVAGAGSLWPVTASLRRAPCGILVPQMEARRRVAVRCVGVGHKTQPRSSALPSHKRTKERTSP